MINHAQTTPARRGNRTNQERATQDERAPYSPPPSHG